MTINSTANIYATILDGMKLPSIDQTLTFTAHDGLAPLRDFARASPEFGFLSTGNTIQLATSFPFANFPALVGEFATTRKSTLPRDEERVYLGYLWLPIRCYRALIRASYEIETNATQCLKKAGSPRCLPAIIQWESIFLVPKAPMTGNEEMHILLSGLIDSDLDRRNGQEAGTGEQEHRTTFEQICCPLLPKGWPALTS